MLTRWNISVIYDEINSHIDFPQGKFRTSQKKKMYWKNILWFAVHSQWKSCKWNRLQKHGAAFHIILPYLLFPVWLYQSLLKSIDCKEIYLETK